MDKDQPTDLERARTDFSNAEHDIRERKAWAGVNAGIGLIALFLVLGSLIWLAEVTGLLAAALPGGQDTRSGIVVGLVGVMGLTLLVLAIIAARGAGRARG